MSALKILGLVILSAFVVTLFVIGYRYSGALADMRRAKEAALEVDAKVQLVVATGEDQIAEITIPWGYTLRFVDNQIFIDNMAFPEGGYFWRISGPELGQGSYALKIKFENDLILVSI